MVMEVTPSSQSVGREFVRQYYTLLNRAPNHLHRFYSNNSSFIHGGLNSSDREIVPAVGQKEIHRRIQELDFRDCHAKISQVDSQATLGDGVVVQVTGELSNSGEPMRRFTQTFVLAAQAPKTFYVHNDIFRYQDLGFPDEEEGETGLPESAEQEGEEVRSETEEEDTHTHSAGQIVSEVQSQPSFIPSQPANLQPAVFYSPPPQPQVHASMQPAINGSVHEETPLISQQQPPALPQQADQVQQVPSQISYASDSVNKEQFPQEVESAPEKSAPVLPTTEENVCVPTENAPEHQKTENFQTSTTEPDPDINMPKSYARTVKSAMGGSGPPTPKLSVSPPPMTNLRNDDRSVVHSTTSAPSMSTNLMSSGPQQIHRIPNQTTHQQQHQQAQHQQQVSQPQRQNRVNPIQKDNQRRRDWPDNHQLFVGNVPHQASEPELRIIFERFGKVVDLHIHCKANDRGKGPQGQNNSTRVPNYGFVTFEDPSVVAKVLEAPPIGYPDDKGLKLNIEEKKNRPRAPGDGNMRANQSEGNMRSSMGGQQQQQQRGPGGSGGVMRGQHGGRVNRGGFSRSGGGDGGGGRSGMRQPANVGSSNYQSRR